jgi:hypothetical protein
MASLILARWKGVNFSFFSSPSFISTSKVLIACSSTLRSDVKVTSYCVLVFLVLCVVLFVCRVCCVLFWVWVCVCDFVDFVGFVGLWVCGFVGLWVCGFVVLWFCG